MNPAETSLPDLVKTVGSVIETHGMLSQGDRVLAAVSGGPDSMTLARVLLALAPAYGLTLGLAHVNHGLRGEESFRDARFVKAFSNAFSLPFFETALDVGKLAKTKRISIEEAGRNARYDFLSQTAREQGFSRIATGHTWDDNAEAIFMNLLRGTGLTGLKGIPPVRQNPVGAPLIRPLIQTPRNRIMAFLEETGQAFVQDSTNQDTAFLRNRVRLELFPFLEARFNPEIKQGLNRLGRIARMEDDYLSQAAKTALEQMTAEETSHLMGLALSELTRLHPALAARVVRQAIGRIKKNLRRITLHHIEDILVFSRSSEPGKSLDLPGQIRVYKTHDLLYIKKEALPLRQAGRIRKEARQAKAARQMKNRL